MPTRACIAREPLARVLREANPDVRACERRLQLPLGRYVVRLEVDTEWGRVRWATVSESPSGLTAAQRSCFEAAYLRLQFPHVGPRPPEPRSRVPRLRPARRGATVRIAWPLRLEAPHPGSDS